MHSDPDPTGVASPRSHASVIDHETGFVRELGLFDSTMIVIGAMIGSGIFIVSADMARNIGSPGWLLVAWVFAGLLTTAAALSYGELAAMMPKAGGMYIYLREAFSLRLDAIHRDSDRHHRRRCGWLLSFSWRAGTSHFGTELPDPACLRFEPLRFFAFHCATRRHCRHRTADLDQ